MSSSLWPHGLQHTSLLCPLLFAGVWSNSCPLSWWYCPTISCSAASLSFCLQSFPVLGAFPMSGHCTRWPKCWSFSFSINPFIEYSGMISSRNDWFDLLADQGTLKSLQHYNSKASVLKHSAFFTVQLCFIYPDWKNHSFDCTDLCQHSEVSGCIKFLSSGLASGGSHTKMLTTIRRGATSAKGRSGKRLGVHFHCIHRILLILKIWSKY